MVNANQQHNLPVKTQIKRGNLRLKVIRLLWCGFVTDVDLEKLYKI